MLRRRQSGASLVELLIGTAVGMFVVAGALGIFAAQTQATRQTRLELRVNQEMRAAADVVARDLRRAGYWQNAILGTTATGAGSDTTANPYRVISTTASSIAYDFSRDAVENDTLDGEEQFGFRIASQVLQMQTADGTWQALTDPSIVRITGFTVEPTETSLHLGDLCPTPCVAGTPNCPTTTVRHYRIVLDGQAAADAALTRRLQLAVRVRNDRLEGSCPA